MFFVTNHFLYKVYLKYFGRVNLTFTTKFRLHEFARKIWKKKGTSLKSKTATTAVSGRFQDGAK